MSALSDLLAAHTELTDAQVAHLQRLVGEWQLLSDLAFADLLLWVPIGEDEFLCVAQCRPTTGPTAYYHDRVTEVLAGRRVASLRVAWTEGRIFRESDPDWDGDLPIMREVIPVRCGGDVIAVLGRDGNLVSVRSPSQLELVYLQTAADLSVMVADGTFPPLGDEQSEGTGPRVGDGMLRVERDGTVLYTSPNALSAFRRLGVTGNVIGERIDTISSGIADDPLTARDVAEAIDEVIEHGGARSVELTAAGATVLFRALPLRPHGEPLGALVLLQDVTELRSRELQIMSKDATIREIHHRVKNNLQTVAALLRLQARRVAVPEARLALEESMRRVSSIALVHETLSSSIDEEIDFDGIVDRLLAMLSDVTGSGGRVTFRRSGSFGEISADRATPLVLVLTELVQNAVEHAFDGRQPGTVLVAAERAQGRLTVAVVDDGIGLPPGFTADGSDRLGLQIARTLVSAELAGTLELRRRGDVSGTEAVLSFPFTRSSGTSRDS